MLERVETARLILRKPQRRDAEAIFTGYASDGEVTRWVSFPTHTSLQDTLAFVEMSDAAWAKWPAGPYLVESREDGRVLGGSGLAFEAHDTASTGYVFARDVWGKGYATETLNAMVGIARDLGVRHLYAVCHPENLASRRVLEKCGFRLDAVLPHHSRFPNLQQHKLFDVLCYVLPPGSGG